MAKLENGDEPAKQTETEDLKSTPKMIHVQDCERLREALENQGLRAKRSFSDRPSEWRHEDKEAKKRRTSGLRVKVWKKKTSKQSRQEKKKSTGELKCI